MLAGSLFTEDYLRQGVRSAPGYAAALADAPELARFASELFAAVGDPGRLNEAQTEDRIVRPLLDRLGWAALRVVQAAATRQDIPDYLLFPDADAFHTADPLPSAEKFRHAVAVGDAKAWAIGLDRRGGGAGANETPAGQLLRYMDRAAARSARCRLGVLTNGRTWRLYSQDVGDRLQRFFEVDLLAVAHGAGAQGADAGVPPLFGLRVEPQHAWALFALLFGCRGFGDTQRLALHEGRLWETRVRDDLSRVVFDTVYPGLVRALAAADPQAPAPFTTGYLQQVRASALTLLYRLLFALYAEDRDLLPWRDRRFDDYALSPERDRVARRLDEGDHFSPRSDQLWSRLTSLFAIVDEGDEAAGVPPYNGGLFAPDRAPLLGRVRLSDHVLAPLLDALSRRIEGGEARRINYRDLSVRELGSIYERLLEHEPTPDASAPGGVAVRLSPFARKGSGSYYTPDVLVKLIVERTLRPLVRERLDAFEQAVAEACDRREDAHSRSARLDAADPATAILALKVCDPAMGSGHFLVDLVDWLALEAFKAIGGAEGKAAPTGLDWRSPMAGRLEALRTELKRERDAHGWIVSDAQLTDENLIKRLVLKRCVFGVDKNPMAVELAKVALWLHTFTAGAPLSFLDHHLRCGDSLFGEWADEAIAEVERPAQSRRRPSPFAGAGLFLSAAVQRALSAELVMARVEASPDAVLAEVEQSAADWQDAAERVRPLQAYLDFRQAVRWMSLTPQDATAVSALLDGRFGDPLAILAGDAEPNRPAGAETEPDDLPGAPEPEPEQLDLLPGAGNLRDWRAVRRLVAAAREIAGRERFLHWQTAFPGVWRGWRNARTGGFDAAIGNPPWDRMKMQEVEWFAERAPAIARQVRASDRKVAISALRSAGDPLARDYDLASGRAETAMRVARESGGFPLMSRGDINLYSLFVERAQALLRPEGIAGLLTPSGIASDLTAAPFFRSLSTAGRVLTLYDFENRRGSGREPFFAAVDSRFKFCAFVAGAVRRTAEAAECGFFLQDAPEPGDPRLFRMAAADFARVNPNTGTAPIFRSARDAEITRAVYGRLPVLVDRSSGAEVKAWPVRYLRMFDMTNDSRLFWTTARLEAEGAYPIGSGRWAKAEREWLPLYSGRMIQLFNHRAAGVEVNEENVHNAAVSEAADEAALADPGWSPTPQYWVDQAVVAWPYPTDWGFSFRDIARATDVRTIIGAVVPKAGFGNKAPLVIPTGGEWGNVGPLIAGNLNSLVLDYVARSKVMSTSVNWFIVEQLPVVPHAAYARRFGALTAAEIVRDHVLRLSYTAWDLAPFARDMGHVYADGDARPDGAQVGDAKPPFRWDEAARRQLRARLDALYFILYGVTEAADVDHVLSTFPIVERHDRAAHGAYLTAELVRWHLRALLAGDPARDAPEPDLIAAAARAARRVG